MQIENRLVSAIYRGVIFALAVLGIWMEFSTLGWDTLRLFSGWTLLAITIYYFMSTIVTAARHKRPASRVICPMFQGMLILAGFTLLTAQIMFYFHSLDLPPLSVGIMGLVYNIIPLLVWLDWLFLSEKGRWRATDPLYWLALPTIYVCVVLTTAVTMPQTAAWRFPYIFLNWPAISIETMLWYFALIVTLMLAFGYLCWLADFAMSGKLAQAIVMPRIKTIVVDENGEELAASAVESADEPAQVIEPTVKIKVEGLHDKKSAQNMHKVKATAEKVGQKSATPAPVAKQKQAEMQIKVVMTPEKSKQAAGTVKKITKPANQPKKQTNNKPKTKQNGKPQQKQAVIKPKTDKPADNVKVQRKSPEAKPKPVNKPAPKRKEQTVKTESGTKITGTEPREGSETSGQPKKMPPVVRSIGKSYKN